MTRHNYSSEGATLEKFVLDDVTFRNIGRIFRATAELEDIATAYLRRLSKLTEGQALILLGRTPMSKRLDIARNLASAHGPEESAIFRGSLGLDDFGSVLEFRNIIAHGVLLGRTEEGRLAFRSAKQIDANRDHVTIEVCAYSIEEFEHCASTAEAMVFAFEEALGVKEERATRHKKALGPHVKAPRRRSKEHQGV